MTEKLGDPVGNIWITSKARMEAEKRFRTYDIVSHFVLIWYSLCLLFLTTFSQSIEPFVGELGTNELSVFLSASVLVLSVSLWGLKFGETANKHRDCYLELDELLTVENNPVEAQKKYRATLKQYPNHSTHDKNKVMFDRIVKEGGQIMNREGQISFGRISKLTYIFRSAIGVLFGLTIFLLPFIIGALLYGS